MTDSTEMPQGVATLDHHDPRSTATMTTITHSNSRTTRTYPTRAAALAALRETYGAEIATYDCDGEPGRTLVWVSRAAMDADKSGGGSAVAEINEGE